MEKKEAGVHRWTCSGGDSVLFKIKSSLMCQPKPRDNKPNSKTKRTILNLRFFGIFILVLFFLLSTGVTIMMWFTDIYIDQILNQMTLKKGTQVFEAWSKPPVKPLICGHVFNYTNMDDFVAGRAKKIRVEEVGPYCYRETQEKMNITFNEDDTVTYGDLRKHVFEPDFSKGKLDDILIVPNMALISAVAMSQDLNYLAQMIVSSIMHSILEYSNTMVTVRAHEYFFGYDDKLIGLMTGVAKFFDQEIPFDKFGLLSQRAAITSETVTVRTGSRFLDEIGVVTKVNGQEKLSAWYDDECNRIDGSDGAFFPRSLINESATLYLFHKDLCRRMPFVFDKEVDFQDGVIGMRFHAAPDVYNTNGTCFCPDPTTPCAPNGVFDLSHCAMNAPVMMSFPHFLYAEKSVLEPFEGLHPDTEKHEFYIDVQRLLGFTLGTVSRLQLNVKVKKQPGFSMLHEFPDNIILPIVWFQVSAQRLPPDLFRYIYHSSVTVKRMQIVLQWGSLILTLLFGTAIIYVSMHKSKIEKVVEEKIQEMIPINNVIYS